MNEIQIVAPQTIHETEALSLSLAKSALLPEALRGKQADILATILTGAELGLAPMQSLRGIQIIKGKPTLSADTMGALCKRRSDVCEHLSLTASSPTGCTYETKRRGEKPTTMTFTIEDAQRAGLAGSDTYRKFPAAMLRARCLSAICRAVYPDLCLGLYDPDELADAPAAKEAKKEREVNAAPASPPILAKDHPPALVVVPAHATPMPPPKRRLAIKDESAPTVTFGPTKNRPIAGLTPEELAAAIGLGEERVAASPSANWASQVSACVNDLKKEQSNRAAPKEATP